MSRKRTRWIIFIALAALVIASAAFLITTVSKDGFQFLKHTSLVNEYEAVGSRGGAASLCSSIDTYRSNLSVDYLGKLAETELIAKSWKKDSKSDPKNSWSFSQKSKTILITSVSGNTNVYIFETRPANIIDRARVWMKGLWKKGKK